MHRCTNTDGHLTVICLLLVAVVIVHNVIDADIDMKIERLFAQDFEDEKGDCIGLSVEDRIWIDNVSASLTKQNDGHIEIALPFKNNENFYPNNKVQALNELRRIRGKLLRDTCFCDRTIGGVGSRTCGLAAEY